MKLKEFAIIISILLLTGCASTTPTFTPTQPATGIPASPTLRFTMIPTWTPVDTPTPRPTRTPRNTSTPVATQGGLPIISAARTIEIMVDRPTYAQKAKPANLVTMEYDPTLWSLNTAYPTVYLGYALTNRSIYSCKLEPTVGVGAEGYEVEHYGRQLGTTTYEIARASQAGVLKFANYCTGEGEDATCYQMTPGDDHEACTQAVEEVLGTYQLIANPFYGSTLKSPNRWICQDAAGTVGLCLISYSIPLNTLAFSTDGQAWAAGDDGILLRREGQAWQEVDSPAQHPLYDLNFSNATNGWAVGDGAEVLRWDGNQWKEVLPYHAPGEGPGGATQVLYAVDAYSVNEAWMVGVMKGIDGRNQPYTLHWNGKDLVEENAFPECNCGLNAVLIVGRDDVFAAGGSDLGAIIFHWDGSSWTSTSLAGADHLYTLSQATDGTLWTSGIEVARDQSDSRGVLFYWDGTQWQRVAVPPLTGGIYAQSALPGGQIVVGGDFTALLAGLEWQPITTDIAGFGWIVDIEQDLQNNVWALTRSGNLFELGITR
jgi:hypothetical protein